MNKMNRMPKPRRCGGHDAMTFGRGVNRSGADPVAIVDDCSTCTWGYGNGRPGDYKANYWLCHEGSRVLRPGFLGIRLSECARSGAEQSRTQGGMRQESPGYIRRSDSRRF